MARKNSTRTKLTEDVAKTMVAEFDKNTAGIESSAPNAAELKKRNNRIRYELWRDGFKAGSLRKSK